MDFSELVVKRYSVRAYKPDMVEEEKLQKALEAARLAPTAANHQPFRIFVVHTKGKETDFKKMYSREWFTQAPVVICFCIEPAKAWVRSDGLNYAIVDATIAASNFILAATELGLGTCWIGAFNPLEVRKFFNLGKELEPLFLIPVGYPADKPAKKIRKSMQEIVSYLD